MKKISSIVCVFSVSFLLFGFTFNNIDKEISSGLYVNKFPKQGSGMISSIAFSDGIIEIPEHVSQINKGDKFDLYLFDQMFN